MAYRDATRHRISLPNQDYLLTFCVQGKEPLFSDFSAARSLIALFRQAECEKRMTFRCWVVMPDHVHALVTLDSWESLSVQVGYIKARSAQRIGRGRIWQKGFHERTVRREEDRQQMARYIVMNPVRAGLVSSIRHYPHWDAIYL